MRAVWAIVAGITLGAGVAWWLAREAPEKQAEKQRRAERAATAQARDALPSLYRWRDEAGVLQITDTPPEGRPFERIDRDPQRGIQIKGEPGSQ